LRLYEYEGKELLEEMEIRVPKAEIVSTTEEILQCADKIGFPLFLKAQVQSGGRGKKGLVREVENKDELVPSANDIKSRIGAGEKLLIEEKITAVDEAYIGITIDDIRGVPVLVISAKGGMDVEKIAETDPQFIVREYIKPLRGLYYHQIINALKKAGYQGIIVRELAEFIGKLYRVFIENEADTVEINPVMILDNNRLVAADAKVILDDYAIFRKKNLQKYKEKRTNPESNTKAIYVPLDGDIGIISVGASNTMMLIDSIKYLGGNPANFADAASGIDRDTIEELASLILRKSENKAKVILINITLAGASLKLVIEGVIKAITTVGTKIPLIANIRATGAAKLEMTVDEAVAELQKVGVINCQTLEEAIDTVIKISKD
jgi:succinyl-CoA synthetase beta subunit